MKFIKEFKEFAVRGNVMDMTVGVIVGGAFGKIVSSFIGDLVMPPLGLIVGNVDFSDMKLKLRAASEGVPAVTLNYGAFLTHVLDFAILAFVVFLMVKGINALRRTEPPAPPTPTEKECGDCAMNVPLKAKKCGHCGLVFAK